MEKDRELNTNTNEEPVAEEHVLSETWAEDCIAELDDFIESQGIYIRQ